MANEPLGLPYVGPPGQQGQDIATYTNPKMGLPTESITAAQVQSQITSRLASYIQTPDTAVLNSTNYKTRSSFDADKATLVPKTWAGLQNGVASLDADGLLPVSQFPDPLVRKAIGFYTPTSYIGYQGSSSAVLATMSIPPQFFPYRVLFWGSFEARGSSASARRPEVYVRDSNSRIVAVGVGRSDTNYHQVVVSPVHIPYSYSGTSSATFQVVGAFTSGVGTGNVDFSTPHAGANHYSGVCALVIPFL